MGRTGPHVDPPHRPVRRLRRPRRHRRGPGPDVVGRARPDVDRRLLHQRPRRRQHHPGADLLHGAQAGDRLGEEARPGAARGPRLGRQPHQGGGRVLALPRPRLRRPLLRPARLRRVRRQGPRHGPEGRGRRRHAADRPRGAAPLGAEGPAGRPPHRRHRGSYGGGYQYVGAFAEIAKTGRTRFDALAPEYTWWDINDALAPSGVVRSEWLSALYAVGLPSDAHTDPAKFGFPEGIATGRYPAALKAFWHDTAARRGRQGLRLDIPVLVRQGVSDNLFNLNQALKNLTALTPAARVESVVIGFHGGQALPAVLPRGSQAGAPVALGTAGTDPCSPACRAGRGTPSTSRCASTTSTSRAEGHRSRPGPLRLVTPRWRLHPDHRARHPEGVLRRHRHRPRSPPPGGPGTCRSRRAR